MILGAGMLGLTASALCRERGAAQIIVADVNAARVAQAEKFGATHAIDIGSGSEPLRSAIAKATDGHGADLVLEMSGSSDAAELGLEVLRIGGKLVLVGSVFPARPVQMDAERVVRRLIRIEGVHNYLAQDLSTALAFLSSAHTAYPFAQLIAGPFSLLDADQAFRHAISGSAFRVAVRPDVT